MIDLLKEDLEKQPGTIKISLTTGKEEEGTIVSFGTNYILLKTNDGREIRIFDISLGIDIVDKGSIGTSIVGNSISIGEPIRLSVVFNEKLAQNSSSDGEDVHFSFTSINSSKKESMSSISLIQAFAVSMQSFEYEAITFS